MDDLIDRQAAIDAMCELMHHWFGEDIKDEAREISRELGKLPSAQPEPKWIPVSERLPEAEKKRYWVCTDTGYQCECRWTNNRFGMIESDEWGWSIFDTPQYTKVVAWMLLPEPYRKETEDATD